MEWSDIESQRGAAQSAQQTATDFEAQGYTLADELRKAIGTKFGEGPIPQATAQARAGFLQAPSQARSDIAGMVGGGTILSPSQQQAIMSSKLASALVPLSSANIVQGAAFGGIGDMINAASNAWQGQVAQKQGLASLEQNMYTNMLNELVTKAGLEPKAPGLMTVGEGSTIFDPVTGQPIYTAPKTYKGEGGSGGGGLDWIGEFINKFGIGNENQPAGTPPAYTPAGGAGTIDGNWYFDGGDWIPVVD